MEKGLLKRKKKTNSKKSQRPRKEVLKNPKKLSRLRNKQKKKKRIQVAIFSPGLLNNLRLKTNKGKCNAWLKFKLSAMRKSN